MNTELQSLQQDLERIKQENAEIRAQFRHSESRYRHAERRFRVRSGLALAVVVGTLLLSPTSRQAIAQGYGVTLQQLAGRVSALENKTQFISIPTDGEMHIVGTNLHIENGLGATNGLPDAPGNPYLYQINGKGNLIIGYNTLREIGDNRTGSHNLILGDFNNYSSFGGLIAGSSNEISDAYATISGGNFNISSGKYTVVSGGYLNTASDVCTVVSGGRGNTSNGFYSTVSGGFANASSSIDSTISGGSYLIEGNVEGWAAGGNSSSGAFHSP